MKNILTIYKFNFPFFDNIYERMKARSIISDMKELFLYYDVKFIKEETKKWNYIITTLKFWGNSIKTIYHDDNENYFIPKYQFDLYVNENIDDNIYIWILKIFETMWLNEYIFDFENYPSFYKNFDILKLIDLEKNFKNYNYKNLKDFIENTDPKYIDDRLRENKIIRNCFYYLLFICFIFYRNLREADENIKQINTLIDQDIFDLYKANLDLWKIRLVEIEDISLVNFKKYKIMIDKLFKLIS